MSQMVKNLPMMQETWVWSLGQEDPLEKGMATHSCILAWRIPWTEEPGGLQSMGSQRIRYDWVTNTSLQNLYVFLRFTDLWFFVDNLCDEKSLFIYLFLAMQDLCCCLWAFSGCSKWRLLSSCGVWASHCGFSCAAGPLGHKTAGFNSCSMQTQ